MFRCGYDPSHASDILIDGIDGCWFVNYLSEIFDFRGDHIYWDNLGLHAEMIAKQLAEHKNNPRILKKYIWLADYHNYYCHLLSSDYDECNITFVKHDSPKHTFRLVTKDG